MLAFGMPAGFSNEQVEAIARLAQLELDASEVELFARQLGDFLDYARQLQQIDTTGVLPTASIVTGADMEREDVEHACLDRQEALANAPDGDPVAGLFKVPRVIG